MEACLQQPMFCSREGSTYLLMLQQNEKSTQIKIRNLITASILLFDRKKIPKDAFPTFAAEGVFALTLTPTFKNIV